MTKLLLTGDIHGKWTRYCWQLEESRIGMLNGGVKHDRSIQLGDFGFGFKGHFPEVYEGRCETLLEEMEPTDQFIRGNHDDPAECKAHPRYLQDGHYEPDTGIMCIGGAFSIDWAYRIQGVDGWIDEELSYEELGLMMEKYLDLKPRIMLTHECPEPMVKSMFSWYDKSKWPSRTREAFGQMWQLHKPEQWFFGHWHKTVSIEALGTRFQCLDELDYMLIDI